MGGNDSGAQYNFTGIKYYFNSYTLRGRVNCVLATYASLAALAIYFKFKPKKQAAVTDK